MSRPGRRQITPARWAALPVLALLALTAACTLLNHTPVMHRWARTEFEGLSYTSVYSLVATTLDSEGWDVRERDIESGTLVTDWRHGPSHREFRGPTRLKVHAEIEPYDGGCRVGLRVQSEVLAKGGVLAYNPRESDDWEPVDDDFDRAEVLLARVRSLVRWNPEDHAP